ncbi:MAG TPA: tetratricopeptide repeat protein [Syntrophobacteria bacterium]|nr:tetratricopeptide repeat protein [Syntrophobacteria bacterium]
MRRGILCAGLVFLAAWFLSGCSAYMRGNAKLSQKQYAGAIADYQEALAQDPDHWQARRQLGYAYIEAGQYDKAVEELTKVLQQRPGDPDATYYLGLAQLKNEQLPKATQTWKTYKNTEKPLVAEAIRRQVTVVEIAESLRLAKQALAEEAKLQATPPKPGTVAVFYFKDLTPDRSLRPLQKALAMMVITDLAQVRSLQVVERLQVQALLSEMELGQTGIVEERTAPRAGRLLGAESLIVGTFEPGSLVVKTSVASSSKQDVVGSFSLKGEEQKFFELEKDIVFNVLKVLRVSPTAEEQKLLGVYQTTNLQAVTYFGQGLDALDQGNWKEARNLFHKAVAEDPRFALARWWRDSCPDAGTPGMGSLGGMTGPALGDVAAGAVAEASSAQGAAGQAEGPGGAGNGGEAGQGSGGVGVGW